MRRELLGKALSGGIFSRSEARDVGLDLASGESESAQVAALLGAMASRGEKPQEVAGLAEAFREVAAPFPAFPDAVDTCGTGGDGRHTFNLSTAAAVCAASLGVKVAKHGNRSVSSSCGSADLLEVSGYPLDESPAISAERLETDGFAFLFAPLYHPAMAKVAAVRRSLGVKTVFNLLGPLLNPAGVRRQVLGVYERGKMEMVGEALTELRTDRSIVVHGEGGYDEAVLFGNTAILEISRGRAEKAELAPSDFGFPDGLPGDLAGGDAEFNGQLLRDLVDGRGTPGLRRATAANAALALRVAGACEDLKEASGRAEEALGSGSVGRFFDRVIGRPAEAASA